MAMIKCAECGKEFSDRANACPNCGCPIEYQAEKSMGGEYHAADKLAPSVIVEHLTIAKELESERYTLLCTINKLQTKINRLGIKKEIEKPEFNMKHKVGVGFAIGWCIGFALGILIFFSKGSMAIHYSLFTSFGAGSISFLMSIFVCLSIKNKKNQNYLKLVHDDETRVADECREIDMLKQQQTYLRSKVEEISKSLDSLYSLNIIYPKYRYMVAVIRMLEYFESGRCTALTGADGAYNKYEDEVTQETIISRLDVAINCLYQLKENQHMLYDTLEDCLDTSDRIASQVSTLTDSNKNIEACSAVAAYNSKIAASNSDALVFIEAYKGANGL